MPEQPDEDRNLSFEQIHKKYETKIHNLILSLVGNRETAEDLTVETFVNAYRAWDRFRDTNVSVSAWLHAIAVNNCKNRFQQNDRRRGAVGVERPGTYDPLQGLSSAADETELERKLVALERDLGLRPKEDIDEAEQRARIQRAIAALPPEYRTVLELCENEDKSYEEIARILDLTVPAVKTRLHRARTMVRRILNLGPLN